MAGTVSNHTKDLKGSYTMTILLEYFHQCLKSWYIKYKSNETMKDGTNNEDPTFDKLKYEIFVVYVFDAVMLRDKSKPSIDMSPDRVLVTEDNIGNRIYACVEIKTIVLDSTITIAKNLADKYGRIIYCHYDNLHFK